MLIAIHNCVTRSIASMNQAGDPTRCPSAMTDITRRAWLIGTAAVAGATAISPGVPAAALYSDDMSEIDLGGLCQISVQGVSGIADGIYRIVSISSHSSPAAICTNENTDQLVESARAC